MFYYTSNNIKYLQIVLRILFAIFCLHQMYALANRYGKNNKCTHYIWQWILFIMLNYIIRFILHYEETDFDWKDFLNSWSEKRAFLKKGLNKTKLKKNCREKVELLNTSDMVHILDFITTKTQKGSLKKKWLRITNQKLRM